MCDRRVSCAHGVDVFLIRGPEGRPVQIHNVTRGSLFEDEFAQAGDGAPAAPDAADGGHAGVVPAPDDAFVDELGEFAFGEEGADEVHAVEVPVVDVPQFESVQEPLVLRVAVFVFGGAQGVGDAFVRVVEGAGEGVGGVDFPRAAGAGVGWRGAAVDDGVAEGAVGGVVADFGAYKPFLAGGRAGLHVFEAGEGVGCGYVAAGGGFLGFTLFAHEGLVRVVGVGVTVFDYLHAPVVEFPKVVGGVRSAVGVDAHEFEVADDGVFKFLLLFERVGVIEAEDEGAFVFDVGEVVVQERCFSVADVQIARGFRGKTCHDAGGGVLEADVVVDVVLDFVGVARLGGLSGGGICGWQ